MRTYVSEVGSEKGPGRLLVSAPDAPVAVLLLGHGAGGGADAFDLVALTEALPDAGVAVVRHEQPWRVAGRRVAGPPATLDAAWRPAVAATVAEFGGVPLFVGGRSAGARVACRCFAEPARGVVALSFPLHPPGKPGRSRIDELTGVAGPVLVVQGERDPFGSPAEIEGAVTAAGGKLPQIVPVPLAAHSFAPRSQAAREASPATATVITEVVAGFILSHLD